ncbi:hypothetical protein DV738_g104, partial [Chaetothyriales sp. CBS 135597]
MHNGSTVQWDGRRHIATFIRSLHLLDLDLLEDWPGLSEHTFTPRALQQNLQQRVKAVEWALFRLFELFSPTEARDKLRPFFPPLTSLQSVNLRAALLRALTELKKNGHLPKEIVVRKTMLDDCKGERLEELLAAFSTLVLRKTLARSAATSSINNASASASAVPESQCVPLILAYRASLQQVLSQRHHVETQASLKKAQLDRHAQSLSQRKARALEQLPTVDPLERGRVVGLLKDAWTGDNQWIKVLIYENAQRLDDATGQSGEQGAAQGSGSSSGQDSDHEGLLHDLNRRLRMQQERLARWTKLEESFPSRPEHPPVRLRAKPTPKPNAYSFKQHQSIAPGLGTKPVQASGDGVRDEQLLPPFAAILHHLETELGKPQAPTTSQNKQPPQRVGKEPATAISSAKQECAREIPLSPKPVSSEFSWLDESGSRSRNNEDSLPLMPVRLSGHVSSFADRVTRSHAPPLLSSDHEGTVDIPAESSERVGKAPEKGEQAATVAQSAGRRGTLLERTRQSIAAYNAKPRPKTRAPKGRSSQNFPTNPFETPRKSSTKALPPSSSRESTPRENLFSDDAESASIFKSRPKVAQSPVFRAAAIDHHDDSLLAGEMTILDIGSSNVGYTVSSAEYPVSLVHAAQSFTPESIDFIIPVKISHGPHPLGDYDDEPPSPVPLVNTDYRIAGGLDTPRAEGADRDEPNWELENDLRVNRFTHPPSPPPDSVFPRTPQHPGDTGDGDGSGRPAQASTSGWGHTLWSLTGSVAGKLINLCWTTAFSGFHAGGGRGYHMQLDTPTVTAAEPSWPDLADDVFDSNFSRRGRGSTPIPGEFPEDDSVQDHSSRLRQRQAADTPLQMVTNDPGASSLRRNWVMIASPSGRRSESASPVRKKHRPSTSISLPGRATARPSYGGRPRKPTAGGGGTSYASPRSSLRSGSSSLLSPPPPSSSCRPVASDHGGRYKLSHTAAAASPRQTYSNPRASEPSSKSPDVLRFERKLRHENLRQSDSIKRMNERMRQLLQEGQQALASKIEYW